MLLMGSLPENENFFSEFFLPLNFERSFCSILFQKSPDHIVKKRMLFVIKTANRIVGFYSIYNRVNEIW